MLLMLHMSLMLQACVQGTATQGTANLEAHRSHRGIATASTLCRSCLLFLLALSKPMSTPPVVLGCMARGVALSWPCLRGCAGGRDMMRRDMVRYQYGPPLLRAHAHAHTPSYMHIHHGVPHTMSSCRRKRRMTKTASGREMRRIPSTKPSSDTRREHRSDGTRLPVRVRAMSMCLP